MSDDMKWAAGVAEVAMLIKNSDHKGTSTYESALSILKSVPENDFRSEFIYLVSKIRNW